MSADTIRTIFDVASLTSVLVLLVLGMAVIVGMMRVFNLCHGELVLLGAVVAYLSNSWFGSVAVGIVLARLSTQGAPVPAPIGGSVTIGGAHVSAWRLVIVVVVVLAVGGTYALLT